jgi:outer membrane protein OmpA-like peptidoglycan-associated protein
MNRFRVLVEAMMVIRSWLGFGCGLALALCAAPVLGQQAPTYTADELAAILSRNAEPPTPAVTTRGLTAGAGTEAGAPGSGVVPDLKVTFAFGSADLTPSARAQLDELAQALQTDALRSARFQISGHTDAVGSDQYNEWLSQERAAAVASYLSSQRGVESQRLQAVGMGEQQMADPQDPTSGINRRVEIRTLD